MSNSSRDKNKESSAERFAVSGVVVVIFISVLAALVAFACSSPPAFAVEPLPPYTVPPEPAPPPIGDGPNPQPVIPGDEGAPDAPPSGEHDPTHGNWFPARPSPGSRAQARLYHSRDDRGRRNVLTMPVRGGGRSSSSDVDEGYLEGLQNDQYPWPDGQSARGRSQRHIEPDGAAVNESLIPTNKIISDRPGNNPLVRGPGHSNSHNTLWKQEENQLPCPTIRKFARLLIIAGVVFGTVYVAFASWAVVLGHPGAGQRAVGSMAGLMLLLMSYAIYKVVMINAFRFYEPGNADIWRYAAPYATEEPSAIDLPDVPGAPGGRPERPGVPVVPLGNALNP